MSDLLEKFYVHRIPDQKKVKDDILEDLEHEYSGICIYIQFLLCSDEQYQKMNSRG